MAYDDIEQGERVQAWLRKNGLAIIIGIVIGLTLFFGYRAWKTHRANENVAAANQFQLIENALAGGNTSQADALTDSLMKNHADSSYAVFAAMLRARHQLDAGKTKEALTALAWADKHAHEGPLKALTQLRLARAQLDAGAPEDALATLKAVPAGAYSGLVDELRGDVQVKLGHADAARAAYQSAMAAFDPVSPQRHIVEMKLNNLAKIPAAAPVAPKSVMAKPSSSPKQDT